MSQEERIRNRSSYQRWKEFAEELKSEGVKKIGTVLRKTDRMIDRMSGYGSRTASVYSSESIELLIKDLKLK